MSPSDLFFLPNISYDLAQVASVLTRGAFFWLNTMCADEETLSPAIIVFIRAHENNLCTKRMQKRERS